MLKKKQRGHDPQDGEDMGRPFGRVRHGISPE
jgi:hypothetical protein